MYDIKNTEIQLYIDTQLSESRMGVDVMVKDLCRLRPSREAIPAAAQ